MLSPSEMSQLRTKASRLIAPGLPTMFSDGPLADVVVPIDKGVGIWGMSTLTAIGAVVAYYHRVDDRWRFQRWERPGIK
ncbi:MAG TPA: hypothetical protein VNT79_02235 [Phycisphaerae bacterium]|nr:hypothetical protein [Phycisphaerae bacterium]